MADRALALAGEYGLSAQFALGRPRRVEPPFVVQLGGRREIEHVLQLGHVADLDAVEDVHTFLYGAYRVAVEVRRPLLELGEVFHRPQAPLRSVNLLIEHAAQARRVEA